MTRATSPARKGVSTYSSNNASIPGPSKEAADPGYTATDLSGNNGT